MKFCAVVLVLASLVCASSAAEITLTQARAIIEGSVKNATAMNFPFHVAVVDPKGFLKAYVRMDGTSIGPLDISIRKARTAALFGTTTENIGKYTRPGQPSYTVDMSNDILTAFGGGIPIFVGGELIGAVGCSAGSVAQDIAVAKAGIANMNNQPSEPLDVPEGNVVGMGITLKATLAILNATWTAAVATPNTLGSMAVVDSSGRLKGFYRQDGAVAGTVDVAIRKARTARYFNLASETLMPAIQPNGALWRFELNNGGMVFSAGGEVLQDSQGKPMGAVAYDCARLDATVAKGIAQAGAAAWTGKTVATPLSVREGISLATAKRALMASIKKAVEIGVPMDIAVLDAGMNLRALARMDDSCLACMDAAWKKAKTALVLKSPSSDMYNISVPYPTSNDGIWHIELTNDGMIAFAGGFPIFDKNNNLIGAIGASSGNLDQDSAVAMAGRDAAVADVDVPYGIPASKNGCALSLADAWAALEEGAKAAQDIAAQDYCLAAMDTGGRLKAFFRMDDARLGSMGITINKAATSSMSGGATADFATVTRPGAPLYSLEILNGGNLGGATVTFGGGEPIMAGTTLIGGFGSGSGTADQDVQVSKRALGAIKANCAAPSPSDNGGVKTWVAVVVPIITFVVGAGIAYCITRRTGSSSDGGNFSQMA